jgi:hypothetical protein
MMGEGRCAECQSKKQLGQPLQAKLRINEPGDVYEQEADRVADQVLAASTHPAVSVAALRIQPYAGHVTGHLGTASTSVDRVLAGSGRPRWSCRSGRTWSGDSATTFPKCGCIPGRLRSNRRMT